MKNVKLGELLTSSILKAIDFDIENTVFSYIPNTAESAFYGMVKGAEEYIYSLKKQQLLDLNGKITPADIDRIMRIKPRIEKVALKDIKLRTFIHGGQRQR